MTHADMNIGTRVAESMVNNIYRQLRQSGYDQEQIVALAAGLARQARVEQFASGPGLTGLVAAWTDADEDGLLLVGTPDGFSHFCRMQ